MVSRMDRAPRTWSLHAVTERLPRTDVLILRGRISHETADVFRTAAAATSQDASLVIDLSAVDYISGEGLRVLRDIVTTRRAPVILCAVADAVRITLELSGATEGIELAGDRETAMARLGVKRVSDGGDPGPAA